MWISGKEADAEKTFLLSLISFFQSPPTTS